MIWVACIMVGADNLDQLLPKLEQLPWPQTVIDLEAKVGSLQQKVNRLKYELQKEKANSQFAINKMNKSLEFIKKIKGYIKQPMDILKKARLINKNLAKNPVLATKVIPILVDFNQKMEELLDNMRSLFYGLEA